MANKFEKYRQRTTGERKPLFKPLLESERVPVGTTDTFSPYVILERLVNSITKRGGSCQWTDSQVVFVGTDKSAKTSQPAETHFIDCSGPGMESPYHHKQSGKKKKKSRSQRNQW